MSSEVKRYEPDVSRRGDAYMDAKPDGDYVHHDDYAALRVECDSLWSTYVALVDKLGIDTEKAKTADGKPSDVIVSYVEALRAENDRLRKAAEAIREFEKSGWRGSSGYHAGLLKAAQIVDEHATSGDSHD